MTVAATDLMNRPIKERFDHLLKVISSERFLKMQGLGNEVPFFICPYKPHETNVIDEMGRQLLKNLESKGIQVLKINLYDLAIELLKQRGIYEQVLASEQEITKEELKELLQGVFDPEAHLIPAIGEKIRETPHAVLFLTGVGEVFPYIRSHTVLNNLQSTAKDHPTVMFFPGEYTFTPEEGSSLDLFGKLHDDKYYRAFNIYHYHI